MKQYIDKATLVAEIERRITTYQKNFDKADNKIARISTDGRIQSLKSILSFLNTLEVKEVELKKDFELTWEDVAWIVNETILKCKVESALTAEDICKDVLKLFKAHKGDIV